ncbi:MAG: FMN-binding protein, partial [Clostridia bacterium]|nr:FMN-binding protein [Clostridia bacterium]
MDYFVKKTWIRIAVCAVLVAVGVLAMTGVFSGNQPLKYDPASVNGATVVSAEATEQGFGGEVTVHATIADNAISELTIDTPNETEGLGKRASDAEFTEQFIGKTGPFTFGENGIEALSGATVTSNAALKAINKAIGAEEPAAGEPAEEKAEEPAAETEAQTMEEETEEPAAEPAEAETALGTTEQGFGGDVTVHVTLDGDKVQALTIDTPNETAGLGQRASEEAFTSQFIGKSAPFTYGEDGIEALSGATITSDAVLKAINRAAGAEEAPSAEPEQAETAAPAAEEKTAGTGNTETAASAEQAYGVYRATKENAFSKVTVTASVKNGKLTDVQITSEGEEGKDLLTDAIRDEWAKAILESGSVAPDAITGASLTFSAGSVQEAMAEILAEMNGGTAEPAVETAEEPATEPAAEPAEAPAAAPEEKAEAKAETSDGQAYGVYRSTKENAFSKVTVTASAKNGKLTDVQISSEGEEGKDLLT